MQVTLRFFDCEDPVKSAFARESRGDKYRKDLNHSFSSINKIDPKGCACLWIQSYSMAGIENFKHLEFSSWSQIRIEAPHGAYELRTLYKKLGSIRSVRS